MTQEVSEISPQALRSALLGDEELALIDVREQGAYSDAHLLFATCVPLSRLELLIFDLVPRQDVPVVVTSGNTADGLTRRAAERLLALGYRNLATLTGGSEGWAAAGFELFSGVNVPSKAFGEFIEHRFDTPRLTAAEVRAMMDGNRNMVIVDSRPFDEYHRMNIPTATDMPGAELVYRIYDLAPDPETFVVVNCAGRTRSIIGAQSLINAGIPNPVAALKDGTMGWHLAGFELERGATREAPAPGAAGREKAKSWAAGVGARFGVESVPFDEVTRWQEDPDRTTFLLDVRSPAEYAAGHLPGFRNAPGGQLVQATDEFVGVRNARLVLADDIGVRATMTASWLIQMGWQNVRVLEGGVNAGPQTTGPWEPRLPESLPEATLPPQGLAERMQVSPAGLTIIDLDLSTRYERAHIPGAIWCVRARLEEALAQITDSELIVLTSADGRLARAALSDARAQGTCEVAALVGGTDRWLAEYRPSSTGLEHTVGPTDDVWYKPYDHRGDQERFMQDYLSWEVALVEQIERDGTTRFR